jgi:hypothetical protein
MCADLGAVISWSRSPLDGDKIALSYATEMHRYCLIALSVKISTAAFGDQDTALLNRKSVSQRAGGSTGGA